MSTESAVAYVSVVPVAKGAGKLIEKEIDPASLGTSVGSKMSGGFLKSVGSMAVKTTAVIGGAVTAIGATIAGVAAKKGIDRLLDIDDAQGKLKGLGHNVDGIAKIMDSALASVKGTAFGLGDAATVAASAVAAGIKPGTDLTKYLSLTADAATIAGVSLDEMGSIINKTTTSGKVYTDSLNQLADRGIPIFQWLQDEYGVSAEKLSEMVQKGEVDSATFRKVIEDNIGGAALASGQTVRGAWANVGAALGRLGAMFLKGGVAGAPALFTSIMNAVDRAATALQPYADTFNTKIVDGMAALAGWIDRIDFGKVVGGVQGLYDLIVKGDFTGQLGSAFSITEDSGFVDFILTVRDAITDLFSSAQSGDFSGMSTSLTSIGGAVKPLLPFFAQVGKGFSQIAGAAGEVVASGLPLLVPILESFSEILGYLGDNTQLLTPLILALAAGFVVYRSAQVAATAAAVIGLPIKIASIAADIARTQALNRSSAATIRQMGLERASTATRIAATGSITASTIGLTAQAVAQKAVTAAQKVGIVVTKAFNAVLRANPIGIIITLIAGLVAGLIWFFTQTEVGQDAWASFMSFLGTAWTWIQNAFSIGIDLIVNAWQTFWAGLVSIVTVVWTAIVFAVTTYINMVVTVISTVVAFVVGLWNAFWTGLSLIVSTVWSAIVFVVTTYITMVQTIITTIVTTIMTVWSTVWGGISAFFALVWAGIVFAVTAYITTVRTVITTVITAISGVWNSIWSGVSSFFAGIWSGIVSTVSTVGAVFASAFGGIADTVRNAFDGVVGIIRTSINGVIGLANSAINSLNGISVAIPDWVPGIGGGSFGFAIPNIPMLAEGGIVSRRPGGIPAIVGEGRYDEAVVPLSPRNLEQLSGGRSGPTTQTTVQVDVHAVDGMDAATVGQIAGDTINWQLRRA
ncbi:tape measure protein [Frigoribacterium faeni]|uniref:Tape measure domain-containing protein n=1 Tax=Frigoribacterium faeni TaxID=145483 RepID=A0A7W3JGZ6_9MICO|nr:tape measure protein [Frigoribacterium faeni]MBA8812664.1 tape measure domain-containing protein [Frigoribacterium faeni]BFF13774.1 hypothetical protein GCM10025699_50770 [Microbacterium flavescens]GEK82323.1 hypothetical protein FFA01_06320 [Frigoribacterium faeni]